jgi:hypothetical protein
MVIFETLVKKISKSQEEKNISKSQRGKSKTFLFPLEKPVMTRRLGKDRNPPCAADMHMSDHVQR